MTERNTTVEYIRALKRLMQETGGRIAAIDGAPYQDGDETRSAPRSAHKKKSGDPSPDSAAQGSRKSSLERAFADNWHVLCPEVELVSEHMPVPEVAGWRADFAILELKIMIEIDGGTWLHGAKGHGYGTGATRDCKKQNAATIAGWRVFRFTSDMLAKSNVISNLTPLVEFVRTELAAR